MYENEEKIMMGSCAAASLLIVKNIPAGAKLRRRIPQVFADDFSPYSSCRS